ncbi:endonuclease domain-containing protein [Uliginosibacterium sp. sgz301328]|uniref:endonuclease domain-containing protein n=1 Tax=Uliginosibacterium sp. sgz301328 TaxID=3243764 RepID=UPI00359D9439
MSSRYPFAEIRSLYREYEQDILSSVDGQWGIDPYQLDWLKMFTPIEESAWASIRSAGLVLYPQYPVGRYFADFASPRKKFILECDGKDFHDADRDAERDRQTAAMGWTVFRVTGAECNRESPEIGDIRELIAQGEVEEAETLLSHWANRTSDGLIHALNTHYFGVQYFGGRFDHLLSDTVVKHRSRWGAR